MRSFATAVLAALLAVTPGLAQDRHDRRVEVLNRSKEPIYYLYGSNTGTSDWEEDVLGDDVIMPGDSAVVNFDDGTGYCMFDFKAEFKSGREETEFGVNVCEVSRVSFR